MKMARATHFGRAILCALLLAATALPVLPPRNAQAQAQAAGTPGPCTQGTLPHGARSLICVPASGWNGDVVVWAHGYVDPDEPLDFAQLTLADGTSIPLLVQLLGFAFATTTYRANGLVILEGVEDVRELIAAIPIAAGQPPHRTYLAGVSEGGLVATLLAERAPQLVTGVLAACGPTGDFGAQIQYVGDFRVLFDAYFPGVIPGSAIDIPRQVIDHWSDTYVPAIVQAMLAEPLKAQELARVAGVAFDVNDPLPTIVSGAVSLLWSNVHATNDARARLGGNPYGNVGRQYTGSANDADLNTRVHRYQADIFAQTALLAYRTTGTPGVPLVMVHTTGDPIVPVWHPVVYWVKAATAGSSRLTVWPVERWGHCNFTVNDAVISLVVLLGQTGGVSSAAVRSGETQIRLPSLRSSTEP
jgi:pimeloyl-ACP methyl ester carboxylesterase